MIVSSENMLRPVVVYKGDTLLAEGTLEECAAKLHVKPTTIMFYTTAAYGRRLAKAKSIDKRRTAYFMDGDDEL